MTSHLLKAALAAALTLATMLGIVALSGTIIFADINPQPPELVQNPATANGDKPPTFSGPAQ
jgi:hypothetical protein